MAKQRQFSGDEATETLSMWQKGPKAAERLASSLLHINNFTDIDPIHPMGGRDGKKDIICKKNEKKFVVAVYFPQSQRPFSSIKKKFKNDFDGVLKNKADGIIFFTNQHLTDGERTQIINQDKNTIVEIFHLERIASILNSPIGYGVRLEFLDIELSKTEQLSYFANKDSEIKNIQNSLSDLLKLMNEPGNLQNIPTEKLNDFKGILETIVGDKSSLFLYGNSMIDKLQVPLTDLKEFQERLSDITGSKGGWDFGNYMVTPMQRLTVPLTELKEFQQILNDITGSLETWNFSAPTINPIQRLVVPLTELERFKGLLYEMVGDPVFSIFKNSPIDKLDIPISQIDKYYNKLDLVLMKLKEVSVLQDNLETKKPPLN